MDPLNLFVEPTENSGYSHVSMGKPKGRLLLPRDKTNEFYSVYWNNVNSGQVYHLAEFPNNYHVPLIGDIDIKLEVENPIYTPSDKLYTNADIMMLIKAFQDAIKEVVIITNPKQMYCVLLEKDLQVTSSLVKNGIHLHFPHLFLSKVNIRESLLPVIKEKCNAAMDINGRKLFSSFTTNPSELIDDVSSKCWLLYGSSKEGGKPYMISAIYDENLAITPYDSCFSDLNIPRALSINPMGKSIARIQQIFHQPLVFANPTPLPSDITYEQIVTLVDLLHPSRSENYNDWWGIGVTLYNIEGGSERMLDLWKKFSSQSRNYDEHSCDNVWFSLSKKTPPSNLRTIGSLIWQATKDNPEEMKKFKIMSIFKGEITLDHLDLMYIPDTDYRIAEQFIRVSKNNYLYGDDDEWYKFNGVVWTHIKKISMILRKDLSSTSTMYWDCFHRLKQFLKDQVGHENIQEITKTVKEHCKSLRTIIKKLENTASARNLISSLESEDMFGVVNLRSLLNKNPELIAFKNGVYDLSDSTFRAGLPQDYLSKHSSIDYIKYTSDHPHVQSMLGFFEKIFPNEELREYFFQQTSEVFLGGNRDKVLMIWTGSGDNGKSVTQSIFEKMLGPYAVKLPKGVVIGESVKAGACFPELVRVDGGVRWAVVDELKRDEYLNASMLKVLTGNDTLYAREIHQKGKDVNEIDPMFKLVIICNTIPEIINPDETTMERLRVIPFESKFVDPKKFQIWKEKSNDSQSASWLSKNKYTYLKDKNLKKQIPYLATALAWYLIEKFNEKEELRRRDDNYEIIVPYLVKQAGIDYEIRCDVISAYVNESFEYTGDINDILNVPSLYVEFKTWYSQNYTTKLDITKLDFIHSFLSRCSGDSQSRTCKGYKMKMDIPIEEMTL